MVYFVLTEKLKALIDGLGFSHMAQYQKASLFATIVIIHPVVIQNIFFLERQERIWLIEIEKEDKLQLKVTVHIVDAQN